ncbi:MAG: hypothetical protein GXP16_01250 [Gammaproteobacteria bacterium]|nr:hypothetical protein [Gammaproteobacteria bacterium]
MGQKMKAMEHRLEGRIFVFQDRLYLVTDVDSDTGFARLSFRVDNTRRVAYFPIPEVFWRLSQASLEAV